MTPTPTRTRPAICAPTRPTWPARWQWGYHLFLACCAVLATLGAAGPAVAAKPPVPVIVAVAQAQQIEDRVEALGTLRANESVALTATVTETISVLHFDDGQRVPAGTVLVEMTSEEEHARLTEATARVREAQRQYRRVQSLATQGTAAAALLDERGRELETAQAQLVAIESRLSDRLIKAPFAGVVGLRNISVGALVEPGDVITTLDDDSVMKLDLSVPSVFLAALRPGLEVIATTRAYGERSFRGSVHSVDSRVDPVTRAVVVRVLLPNQDRLLKPGMLMQVTLVKNPRSALVIPESALMPLGREQFVLLVLGADDGPRVERRKIRIGARRPGEVEVLDEVAAVPGGKAVLKKDLALMDMAYGDVYVAQVAYGVRVNLGIEHQDIDVSPGGEDVIDAAVADVVGPAIAADRPHTLANQVIRQALEGTCLLPVDTEKPGLEIFDACPLFGYSCLVMLRGLDDGLDQCLPKRIPERP